MKKIIQSSHDMIYYISMLSTTGGKLKISPNKILKNYFKQNSVMHSFSSCQWPIGDPQEKDFHFCEADTVAGKPYCQSHCDVAYIDEKELKKEKEAQKNRRIAA